MSPTEAETALKFLPHGPEFRFLDTVTRLTPGQEGAGEYRVRGDEPILRGHFPGDPIFPGVLLIEAAAQLAGIVAQSDPSIPPLPGLKLAAVRGAKFTGAVRPGDVLRLQAQVTGRMGLLIQAEATGHVGDLLVMAAGLTLSGSGELGAAFRP